MRNYASKSLKKVTRYRTPSVFKYKTAEATKKLKFSGRLTPAKSGFTPARPINKKYEY